MLFFFSSSALCTVYIFNLKKHINLPKFINLLNVQNSIEQCSVFFMAGELKIVLLNCSLKTDNLPTLVQNIQKIDTYFKYFRNVKTTAMSRRCIILSPLSIITLYVCRGARGHNNVITSEKII